MRFVIILLFSLCQLFTKGHNHGFEAKGCRLVSLMHFDGRSKYDAFIQAQDLNAQSDLVIDIDDDDNDNDLASTRKYTLLVKAALIHFYLQLFRVFCQSTGKKQFSNSQPLIISTDRYITLRALRI